MSAQKEIADRAGIRSYLTHHQSELRSISTVDYTREFVERIKELNVEQ